MKSPLGSVIDGLSSLRNKVPDNFPYAAPNRLSYATTNNSYSLMQAMGLNGTLFSIISRTSNAAGQVNWRLWKTAPSGKKEDRVEVVDHVALRVWKKPSEVYTRQEFVESEQQHVDLVGEGWWLVLKNVLGWPEQLWPIRPDRIVVVPSRGFGIAGYIYRGPEGERVPLEKDDIIGLRMPNPCDPFRGLGAVQTILIDLDSARYSAEWNRNFFINSAEPGGVIEFPDGLDDNEWKTFMARWQESHKGVNNAHRVATIERGKWVPSSFTQRDMQFVQLRNVSRDVIREAFGIPKFALGDVDDVNRATAEASKAWFAEYLTVPRLERFKGALNNDLLPMFGTAGKGVEFDYDNPVPPDADAQNAERASKTTAFKTLIDAGVNPDDAARLCGLPPLRMIGA